MDNQLSPQVAMILAIWNEKIPSGSAAFLAQRLEKLSGDKLSLLMLELKNPTIGLFFGLFLGGVFALDRFYKGDIILGILRLLSMCILIGFIWALIDPVFVWRGIKKDNLKKINQHLSMLGV